MTAWFVFVIGGIGTYLMRASFLVFGADVELPTWSRRALKYVAPAVFAAIVAPLVVGSDGLGGLGPPDARVLAATIAALVAWRTGSITSVLVVGMCSLWILQWLGL